MTDTRSSPPIRRSVSGDTSANATAQSSPTLPVEKSRDEANNISRNPSSLKSSSSELKATAMQSLTDLKNSAIATVKLLARSSAPSANNLAERDIDDSQSPLYPGSPRTKERASSSHDSHVSDV